MWTSKSGSDRDLSSLTLSRRQGMRALAAAAAGVAATSCTTEVAETRRRAPSEGPLELEFWAWIPGIDKVVDRWNALRPDVQVKFVRVPAASDGAYPKLYAGLEAGTVPDVMQVEYMELPNMVMNDALIDLKPHGIDRHREKFVDWAYEQVSFGSGVYAVPQDSGPVGLFYRRDLFDQWGIEPPATWAEYEQAAVKVRERDAYLVTFPAATTEFVPAMAWQAGGIWFGADRSDWLIDVDNAETRRVLDYWQRLVARDLVDTIPNSGNDWYTSLQDGRIVSVLGASWHAEIIAGNAENTAGKWAVARMPQWDGDAPPRSSNMGGSVMSVVRGTEYPAQALEFALWLNTDPEAVSQLLASGAGYPALRDTSNIASVSKGFSFFGGQRINEVFREASYAIDYRWKWLPTTNQALEYLISRTQDAVHSGGSFRPIATDVEKQVLRDLEKKGLPYRRVRGR